MLAARKYKRKYLACTTWALLCFSAVSQAVPAAEKLTTAAKKVEYFAVVGDQTILMSEFESAYQAGLRKRFYHGKVPQEQLQAFRKEVSQTLIDRALLVQEAKRVGVRPDAAAVKAQLAQYEARYSQQQHWRQNKDVILPGLTAALEEESLLQRFEERVRKVALPNDVAVREYYKKHPELFTTPEQIRLSLILLKVDPASTSDVWQAAREEAGILLKRLRGGADFAAMARIHSADASASAGGDMGYLHKGMLAGPAQQVIDQLQIGAVSEPVSLLTGIALFRLEERRQAKLNKFDDVAERARQLLVRELSDHAWQQAVKRLRDTTKVTINSAAL